MHKYFSNYRDDAAATRAQEMIVSDTYIVLNILP